MKTKAEITLILPQAKEQQELKKAKDFSLEILEAAFPC